MTDQATTDTPTVETPTERIWIYMGQRMGRDNKLSYVWRDHDGEDRWYDKLVGHSVGAAYRVYESGSSGTSVYTSGKYAPRFITRELDDVGLELPAGQIKEWEIEDRMAVTRKAAAAAEKREAQLSELKQAIAPLRERYKRTFAARERAALLALVIQEITG